MTSAVPDPRPVEPTAEDLAARGLREAEEEAARRQAAEYESPGAAALLDEMVGKITDPFKYFGGFMTETPPEVEWLVPGLIPAGALVLVAGRPKAGKSILTLNLAVALSTAGNFLGHHLDPAPVGVIQLEDPPVLIRQRLEKMAPGSEEGPMISAGAPWDSRLRALLPFFIRRHGLKLIVIDHLTLWAAGAKENSAEEMAGILYGLRQVVQETGATIVVVHHSRKSGGEHGDAIRGSSAILAAVDVAFELLHEEEEASGRLRVISRFNTVEDLGIQLDPETLTWLYAGSAREVECERRERQIVEALCDAGRPLTAEEIRERTDIPSRSLYRTLDALVKSGMIEAEEGPSTTRGGRPVKLYKLSRFLPRPEPPLAKTKTASEQVKRAPEGGFCQTAKPYSSESWQKPPGSVEVELWTQ